SQFVAERQIVDPTYFLDTGQTADLPGNLFKLQRLLLAQLELLLLGELVDLRKGKRGLLDFHREDVLGAKAGVDVEQMLKTPKQEARAYERNESHCDFRDHKQVMRLVVAG